VLYELHRLRRIKKANSYAGKKNGSARVGTKAGKHKKSKRRTSGKQRVDDGEGGSLRWWQKTRGREEKWQKWRQRKKER
jgi:hypothetical protein